MAVTLNGVRKLKAELEVAYQGRHSDHIRLRKFWHGRYWQEEDAHGLLGAFFQDVRRTDSTVGPTLKIVRNVLQEVCVKYQSYLTPLPMIRVPTDDPSSTRSRNQGNVKEECLYGLWAENEASVKLNWLGWYLPLMGDCFVGCLPDFDNKMVRMMVRGPENAYPVPSYELSGQPKAIVFAWKIRESQAARDFPNYNAALALPEMSTKQRQRDPDPEIEVLEFSDGNEVARWLGDQKVMGVEHNCGRNLWRQVKFIDVPGEVWGHGAVEQAVGRVQLGNALSSMIYDAAMMNVYPMIKLIKPQSAPEQIPYGPGSVLALQEGGDADYMMPPAGGLLAQLNLLGENEHSIKQGTSMPDVNFGQFDASIITGAAINQLQGAGTGSLVEMVQGVGIGGGLVYWNETALYLLRRLFADDTIYLQGVRPRSIIDVRPTEFSWKKKGKEIIGSLRNEVTFSPYIGQHEKLIMGLQGLGAGLYSKEYVREQVGVTNSIEMEEAIYRESVDAAVLGALAQILQQDPSPENADRVEAQISSYMGGGPAAVAPGPPHPLLDLAAQAGPAPGAAAPPGSGGPQPASGPTPAAGPTPAPQQASTTVSLNEAAAAFQGVQGIVGKVYLVGEIVQRGQTTDVVEVAVTEQADRQTLTSALPQYKLRFHGVNREPTEPFLEVTPGAPAQRGGAEQTSPEALKRVFVA